MEKAHADLSRQALGFAVLNCNSSLIQFYERVGYKKDIRLWYVCSRWYACDR